MKEDKLESKWFKRLVKIWKWLKWRHGIYLEPLSSIFIKSKRSLESILKLSIKKTRCPTLNIGESLSISRRCLLIIYEASDCQL